MNTDKILAESIAKDYVPENHSKIIALKKLDQKAKLPATILTYSIGILSALLLGVGMCFSMKILGNSTLSMIVGIIVGIIGIAGCSINYPLYRKKLKNDKAKYAYEIVQLAKEIAEQK